MRSLILSFILAWLVISPLNLYGADNKAMNRIEKMDEIREQIFGGGKAGGLELTDPEYAAIRDRLIMGEITGSGGLGIQTQEILTLVALATIQTLDALELHAQAALNAGVEPVQMRESLYQIAPYIGFARVDAALKVVNSVFEKNGIKLPLEKQGTVSEESRLQDGLAVPRQLFGAEHIDKMR